METTFENSVREQFVIRIAEEFRRIYGLDDAQTKNVYDQVITFSDAEIIRESGLLMDYSVRETKAYQQAAFSVNSFLEENEKDEVKNSFSFSTM